MLYPPPEGFETTMAATSKKTPRRPSKAAKRAAKPGTQARKHATRARSGRAKGNGTARAAESPREMLGFYRDMLLIRRFEERAGQLYGRGLIGGFCHLYIGQEAIAIGVKAALAPEDAVITSYRDHGHLLAAGADPKAVMAELTGRSGGISSGKGGSMHMFAPERNFFGGHGIVGAQVPIGTGIAFAQKYRGNGGVTLAFFGEGAANQGQVHEAFNMAALWTLPVIFVIENNQYAMGTAIERASAAHEHLYTTGTSAGIPGDRVYGMDVMKVKDAVTKACDHARGGAGPYILEMRTYRYRGHSMSDPAQYRSKEEVQRIRNEHDPLTLLSDRLVKEGHADDDALKKIDREVREIVNEAEAFAEASPAPDPAELFTDVVAGT